MTTLRLRPIDMTPIVFTRLYVPRNGETGNPVDAHIVQYTDGLGRRAFADGHRWLATFKTGLLGDSHRVTADNLKELAEKLGYEKILVDPKE